MNVWLNSVPYWAVEGNGVNPHTGLGDGTVASRISAAGYAATGYWQNVAAWWQTSPVADLQGMVDQLERNLFVDSNTQGRGHRLDILAPDAQEVGVALASGAKPAGQFAGANLVVAGQDFAVNANAPALGGQQNPDPNAGAFVTGLVYHDANANGHYDMGEELSGSLTVSFSASGNLQAPDGTQQVSDAGGYGLKLAPGHWTLSLSGGPLRQPQVVTVDVGTANVEVDFVVPDSNLNQPGVPVVSPVPNQTNNEGDPVALQVNATNANSFTATGLPAGLQINNNGLISGTISPGAAGNYAVTVTAFNGAMASDPVVITWTVNGPAPVISPVPDQANNEGDAVALQLNIANATNFMVTGLPPGLQVDNNGLMSGVISPGAAGVYTITITASNGGGATDSLSFTWTVFPPPQ
jgi:hypothetical protein